MKKQTSGVDNVQSSWALQSSLRDWRGFGTELTFIYDSEVPAALVSRGFERAVGEYSAWLVRRGWARMECAGRSITATPGEWLICTAREVRQQLSDDAHLLSLRMTQAWHQSEALLVGPAMCCFPDDRHPELQRAALAIKDDVQALDWSKDHPAHAYLSQTRLNYTQFATYQRDMWEWNRVLAEVLRREGFGLKIPLCVDENLSQALHMLDSWDFCKPFTERDVASAGKRPYQQLSRACQRTYGVTLFGYWEQRRLDRAVHLLQEQRRQVKEVAYKLGFRQLSHFSAWFKRHTGRTPRSYKVKEPHD